MVSSCTPRAAAVEAISSRPGGGAMFAHPSSSKSSEGLSGCPLRSSRASTSAISSCTSIANSGRSRSCCWWGAQR